MLTYINQQVSQANSLTTLNDLGDLAFFIAKISLITRFLDTTKNSPYENIFTINNLEVAINATEVLTLSLQNEYGSWDYCKYSDIMIAEVIPYWEYTDMSAAKKDTLPNVIKSLLLKVFSI